jgi:hypothetical protein
VIPKTYTSKYLPNQVGIRALDNLDEKIQLLIRGQAWVARKIKEFRFNLPSGSADWFLEAIKIQHEENVDTLKKYFDK